MAEYLYDPHVHTAEVSACGRVPAREMVRLYRDAGYTGIVVTDHLSEATIAYLGGDSWAQMADRFLSGFREAREEGLKVDFDVLWGAEISFTGGRRGDFLVYGLSEQFLKDHPDLLAMGLLRFRGLLDDSATVVYQAHPFRLGSQRARPDLLDGVEVLNGNPRHNSRNNRALAFARRHMKGRIAGSDAHRREDIARAGIVLPERTTNNRDFACLLRKAPSIHPLA